MAQPSILPSAKQLTWGKVEHITNQVVNDASPNDAVYIAEGHCRGHDAAAEESTDWTQCLRRGLRVGEGLQWGASCAAVRPQPAVSNSCLTEMPKVAIRGRAQGTGVMQRAGRCCQAQAQLSVLMLRSCTGKET